MELTRLFYCTVHAVCERDYTPQELEAWAPAPPDAAQWNESFLKHRTLVAVCGGELAGFADLDEAAAYLDRLYVHENWQRHGVATALCDRLEAFCRGRTVTTHASITARPFFLARGYEVVRRQQVPRYGLLLTNFVMQKKL